MFLPTHQREQSADIHTNLDVKNLDAVSMPFFPEVYMYIRNRQDCINIGQEKDRAKTHLVTNRHILCVQLNYVRMVREYRAKDTQSFGLFISVCMRCIFLRRSNTTDMYE